MGGVGKVKVAEGRKGEMAIRLGRNSVPSVHAVAKCDLHDTA